MMEREIWESVREKESRYLSDKMRLNGKMRRTSMYLLGVNALFSLKQNNLDAMNISAFQTPTPTRWSVYARR